MENIPMPHAEKSKITFVYSLTFLTLGCAQRISSRVQYEKAELRVSRRNSEKLVPP